MTVEPRLRRLERTNRLLLVLLLALGASHIGREVRGGEKTETLRCQRLEIVDEEGAVTVALGTDEEGSSGVFIHDKRGRLRITLTHDREQSALFLRDRSGDVRLGTALFAHGGAGYALHGPHGKGAAVLYYKDDGSLTFYGKEGDTLHRVPGK
jgi:hypothetical protein